MLIKNIFPELTDKQFDVLVMYSTGYNSREMTLKLGCSQTAIEQHLAALRDKLNCSRSSELRNVYLSRLLTIIVNK